MTTHLITRLEEAAEGSHPSLTRGQVWCRTCGHTQRVDSAAAMKFGWPKHCGYTMTIDSPEEQNRANHKDKP